MPLTPSSCPPEDREEFMCGSCHHLAVALHRAFGWRMLVVMDAGEPFWEDPEDSDNTLSSVLHVYGIDDRGQAWDIQGVRPVDEIRGEIAEQFQPEDYDSDECRGEEDLRPYVGCWADAGASPIERPLWAYEDQDIQNAWAVAQRHLAGLPGWGPSPAGPRPRC